MAEKEEKKDEAKPARSSKMPIIIVAVVALAGAGGYYTMSKSSSGGHDGAVEEVKSSGHGEAKVEHEKKGGGDSNSVYIHPLDTFIVNLVDQNRTRYLKVTVQLELDRQETAEEVKAKIPQIRDALIILLSSKSIDEIATSEGKYQVRDEIMARVKQFVTKGKVTAAYFTDFVVQ